MLVLPMYAPKDSIKLGTRSIVDTRLTMGIAPLVFDISRGGDTRVFTTNLWVLSPEILEVTYVYPIPIDTTPLETTLQAFMDGNPTAITPPIVDRMLERVYFLEHYSVGFVDTVILPFIRPILMEWRVKWYIELDRLQSEMTVSQNKKKRLCIG